MKHDVLQQAAEYTQKRHRRKFRQKIVTCLAAVVVFCTTYALILPAITMEGSCQLMEHTHSEACYTQVTTADRKVPVCAVDSLGIHQHTADCYNEGGEPVCGYADQVIHQHDPSCYNDAGNLWCPLPEVEAHTHTETCWSVPATEAPHEHSDECYAWEQGELVCTEEVREGHTHSEEVGCYTATSALTCQIPESDGHQHDEACYDENGGLACGKESGEGGHTHGEGCYEVTQTLTCEISEDPGHQHTAECYTQLQGELTCTESTEPAGTETLQPELICEKTEIIPHEHTGGCFADGDPAKELICGEVQILEHQHTDGCFDTVKEAVDTETLTCGIDEGDGSHTHSTEAGCYDENGELTCQTEESGGHQHTSLCYGTWILTCDTPEHVHSAECTPSELTKEEQAQVDAVIALIDALPASEEVEKRLDELEAAGDMEGYKAYYIEIHTQGKAAQDAYDALTDKQKAYIINYSKLEALAWLWSAESFALKSSGKIAESLEGDWAYIKNLKMKPDETTTSGAWVRTGTPTWDADDNAGNDSTDLNSILRTFDTASYTIQFETQLYDSIISRDDLGGVKQGRLYFEFILPHAEEQCRFETDAMGWLLNQPNVAYELVTAEVEIEGETKACQVLRGSYNLVPKGSNESAIGASQEEITVTIRAMQMHNGDTVKPYFTLWLQHNDVGITYNSADDRLPAEIVYGKNHDCTAQTAYANGDLQDHGVEAQSIAGTEINISARLMLNIYLKGIDTRNTEVGTFNFDLASENTINYGLGEITGRLNGYGVMLEARGKTGQGMRGMEFPTGTITFDLKMSSDFQPAGGTKQTNVDGYQPLFWSAGPNEDSISISGRSETDGHVHHGVYNSKKTGSTSMKSVQNGGTWSFVSDIEDTSVIHVTVSGFTFGTHFPSMLIMDTSDSLYQSDVVGDDWWMIDEAIFSCGEVWLIQPFYNTETGTYVCDQFTANGQFYTKLTDSDLSITPDGAEEPNTVTQSIENDDLVNQAQYLKRPGTITGKIYYNQYTGGNYPLTEGAWNNDTDWATNGGKVGIHTWLDHDSAEGEYVGVAYDDLIKFDNEFFEPDTSNSVYTWSTEGTHKKTYLYGGKEGGWTSDEDMKQATVDEITWFTSWTACKEAGYDPVALLIEYRGVSNEGGMNHLHGLVKGTVKSDCDAGVYMVTRNTYAWRKMDVADAVLEYCNSTLSKNYASTNDLTNYDYNAYVQSNQFLTHAPDSGAEYTSVYKTGSDHSTVDGLDNIAPFWYEDYYCTMGSIDQATGNVTAKAYSECAAAYKASYEDGVYKSGHGVVYYQDSCLVMPYKTTVTKATAQREASDEDTPKKYYSMDLNQRTVDYQLTVKIERGAGANTSTAAELDTIVYVEDTLPASLTYLEETAFLGGTYTQDPTHQSEGSVTGGNQFVQGSGDPTEEQPYVESITKNADGTTTIRWAFRVHLNLNQTTWTDQLRFSCQIGTAGVEETDVNDGQIITNTVKVWTTEDNGRKFSTTNGNLAESGIVIQKNASFSLSKVSDQLNLEKWENPAFTMNVGNNSATPKNGTIIVETLPYNGQHRTHFQGDLVVTEFSAALVGGDGKVTTSGFTFYYTRKTEYAGWLGDDYKAALQEYQEENPDATLADWMTAQGEGIWVPLAFSTEQSTVAGMSLYSANNLPTDQTRSQSGKLTGNQIIAIVGIGDLPAYQTLKMHISMDLPEGEAGDYLVNYLSQDNLYSYARTQIINRTLEGLTWLDMNANGIQDDGNEYRISGVKVTLMKLDGNGQYQEYHYQGDSDNPVVTIQTGQQVSVLDESSGNAWSYEQGFYAFHDLPAGTFAVKFEDGNGEIQISPLLASPVDRGGDDTMDSDGHPTYNDGKTSLQSTLISGIVMPEAEDMSAAWYDSKDHDSGFYYRGYQLPATGGVGTYLYTLGGLLLMAAAVLLLYGKAKRGKEDHLSS